MDDARFDALARLFGSVAERRATVRALVGGVFGALGLSAGHQAKAKNKKKKKKKKKTCKEPNTKCGSKGCCTTSQYCVPELRGCFPRPTDQCQFTKTDTVWTMQDDCPSYETIDIPDGVTLDGDGKTMTLKQIGLEHTRAIRAVGVASAGLRNLTIDAEDAAFAMTDAVRFDVDSGLIENVSILNNDLAFTGFNVEGDVDITGVTVDGSALAGIRYGGTGTISDSTVRNIDDFALFILDTGDDPATVEDNELTNVGIGVFVAGTANITTNTIAGRDGVSGESVGVWFDTGAAGSVAGNTISNFSNGASAAEACGILVSETAGAVTIGANDFTVPPANEEDVCDNRP